MEMPVLLAVLRSPQFRKFALGVVLVLADVVATELGRKKAR
jgi:hypothetical protein